MLGKCIHFKPRMKNCRNIAVRQGIQLLLDVGFLQRMNSHLGANFLCSKDYWSTVNKTKRFSEAAFFQKSNDS